MKTVLLATAFALMSSIAGAQDGPTRILFTNVNVWDGTSPDVVAADVLVEGNMIVEVSEDPLVVANGRIIDGGGRTLMPGLIESHVHLNLQHVVGGYDTLEQRDWQEIGAMAAFTAHSLLMDGFTTVRDPGGAQVGIKRAIDRGDAIGPRIYNAVAVISQTAGHGDFRLAGQTRLNDRYTFKAAQLGITHIVDGYDATLSAARQNLANGAVFNKMMLSGGVFSSKDPLHTRQGTDDEIRAVVEASDAWGTYAPAHIFRAEDAQRGIRLGLKDILHIPFLDVETAELMVEKGIWYNPQLSVSTAEAIEVVFGPEMSVNKAKSLVVSEASARQLQVMKDVPALLETTVFGVDTVTNTPAAAIRARDHEIWFWADAFGTLEALKSMTSRGGQLAELTGELNPYPAGPLGVITPGAYADILLIDGNPLEDITLIGGNPEGFKGPDRKAGEIPAMDLIMKDGVIYKNTLD